MNHCCVQWCHRMFWSLWDQLNFLAWKKKIVASLWLQLKYEILSKGQLVVQSQTDPMQIVPEVTFLQVSEHCIFFIFHTVQYWYFFMFKWVHTLTVSCFKRETWEEKNQETPVMTRLSNLALLLTQRTQRVTQVLMRSANQNKKNKWQRQGALQKWQSLY